MIWLHGGGEGRLTSQNYYDNEASLRANRGAPGFATAEAQRIFKGAYVVAPQCFTYWREAGPAFAPLVREMVDDLVSAHAIDPNRIYLAGCSNGGYMTLEMTARYQDLFAGAIPVCGLIEGLLPDEEVNSIETPTWLVTCSNDPVVPSINTTKAHERHPTVDVVRRCHVAWIYLQWSLVMDLRCQE